MRRRGGYCRSRLRIGPLPAVSALAIRGDSRLLAVGTYGQVVLWDLYEGRPAGALVDIPGPVHALAFSRDGRRLAVGAGLPARSGVVRVYSVPDGTLIHDFEGHEDVVYSVALRPDGAQLASASFDQTVRLWNLGLGRPDGVFRGHSDFVYSVAYTPDGRTLVTSGKDRTIKRIDVETLKEARTYSGHDEDVFAVAVHPDGKRFVSAGNEPQLRWWSFRRRQAVGVARRTFRAGSAARVQRRRPASDLGRRRSVRPALGWNDGGGHPSARRVRSSGNTRPRSPMTASWRRRGAGTAWCGSGTPTRAACSSRSSSRRAAARQLRRTITPPPDWLAVTPGGHVAGSAELLQMAQWRAGGVTLAGRGRASGVRLSRGRRASHARRNRPGRLVPVQEGEVSHEPHSLSTWVGSMILGVAWLAPVVGRAQTSYPMMLRVDPVAVRRGQTVEIGISGQENWNGAWAVLCEQPGLRGEFLKVETVAARPDQEARGRAATRGRRPWSARGWRSPPTVPSARGRSASPRPRALPASAWSWSSMTRSSPRPTTWPTTGRRRPRS